MVFRSNCLGGKKNKNEFSRWLDEFLKDLFRIADTYDAHAIKEKLKGGQTRGYLNIRDTLQCVHKSEGSAAKRGELRIFNQIMETFSVNEIAERVQRVGKGLGYNVQINYMDNPRKEAEGHYYNPKYQGLIDIGVSPHLLTEGVLEGFFRTVERFRGNIRKDVIFRGIKW